MSMLRFPCPDHSHLTQTLQNYLTKGLPHSMSLGNSEFGLRCFDLWCFDLVDRLLPLWYRFFSRQSKVHFPLCFLNVVSGKEYKTSTLHKFENATSGFFMLSDQCEFKETPVVQLLSNKLSHHTWPPHWVFSNFFWNQGQEILIDVCRDSSALTTLSQHQGWGQFVAGSLQILPISCHVYSGRLDVSTRPLCRWWHKALKSPKQFLNRRKAYLHDKP